MLRWVSAVVLAAVLVSGPAAAQSAPKFGALAVDRAKSFVFGFAHDYPTRTEAEARALEEARKRGGNPSVVLVWSGAGCGAYRTIDPKDGDAYGWGVARTHPEADAIAQREAMKRANGAVVWNNAWACNEKTPQPLQILKNEPVGEAGGEPIVLPNSRYVTDLAFSPDSKSVATLSYGDGLVLVWDVRTGRRLLALEGLSSSPNSIAWSPDGARIAGSDSQKIIIWNARTGQKLAEQVTKALNNDLAFTADGGALFASGAQEVYDTPNDGWVTWQFDPVNASTARKVTLIGPRTHGLNDTDYSRDGRMAVTGGDKPGQELRFWDLASGRAVQVIRAPGEAVAVRFSPDGGRVVTGGQNGIGVWDVASGRRLLRFGSGRIDDVAFSPDGRRIVSGHMSNEVVVWDAATGQQIARMTGHGRRALSVAFSPDGRVVASGSEDGTARLWDAQTGEPLRAQKPAPSAGGRSAPAQKSAPPKPSGDEARKAREREKAAAERARAEAERAAAERRAAAEAAQMEATRKLNEEVAARAAAVDARNRAAAEAYAVKEAAFKAAQEKYARDKAAYEAEAARVRAAQEKYERDRAAYEEQLKSMTGGAQK